MTRSRLFDLVRLALLVLVVVAVGVALWRNWSAVAAHLSRISWPVLVAAFGLSMLAPILTLMGWRVLLADLGTDLAPAPAASVFLVGQLGKYVPGSVWSVLAQAEMGARLGVPRRRMGVAGLLSIGLSVITGCLVGVPAVPLLRGAGEGAFSPWWVVLAVVLGSSFSPNRSGSCSAAQVAPLPHASSSTVPAGALAPMRSVTGPSGDRQANHQAPPMRPTARRGRTSGWKLRDSATLPCMRACAERRPPQPGQ